MNTLHTSESVLPGHPDKICDGIADSILDAHLEQDPNSRVAVEVLAKGDHIILAGEVTSLAEVDCEDIARRAISAITRESWGGTVQNLISRQAPQLNATVANGFAGDQGVMFGFASDETASLMPRPIQLAHGLSRVLWNARDGHHIMSDGKVQVTVEYAGATPIGIHTIVASVQHHPNCSPESARADVKKMLLAAIPAGLLTDRTIWLLNHQPAPFVTGGIIADAGVTGRKIVVDSYGSGSRVGGGAYSGKDGTKVDRSAAYFARFVARKVVQSGLAGKVEIEVAYCIGQSEPVSINARCFGTGDDRLATKMVCEFDWRPRAIIERLQLTRPIFSDTTNFGHFGRPQFTWEH